MNKQIAIELLGRELDWGLEEATQELSKLEYLSAVKYDSYRNFEAGNRFFESLILWLRQFHSVKERKCAYNFLMTRVLYFSERQMDYLVSILYSTHIIPILCQQTCEIDLIEPFKKKKIINSNTFKILHKKSVFIGMSDGARLDAFRRKNKLSHEQVCINYELSKEKWTGIVKDFSSWLDFHNYTDNTNISNFFLIDDFSGSGRSIFRDENGIAKGKLSKFINKYLPNFSIKEKINVFIVTYISSKYAYHHLSNEIDKFVSTINPCEKINCKLLKPLQLIGDRYKVTKENDPEFAELLKKYYDDNLEDSITKSGGTTLIFGYAGCALPLVLNHNCPNNSVYLLWGQTDCNDIKPGLKALFPRIARHEEGR